MSDAVSTSGWGGRVDPAGGPTTNTITITGHLVRIGPESYPLANISRLQKHRMVWQRYAWTNGYRKAAYAFLAACVLLLLNESAFDGDSGVRAVAFVLILAAIGMVVFTLANRQLRLTLVIETAGSQATAVSSAVDAPIHHLEHEVLTAIENPPAEPRTVAIGGDLVIGDKVGRDKYQFRTPPAAPPAPAPGPYGGQPR
jgi:hypothetical protein